MWFPLLFVLLFCTIVVVRCIDPIIYTCPGTDTAASTFFPYYTDDFTCRIPSYHNRTSLHIQYMPHDISLYQCETQFSTSLCGFDYQNFAYRAIPYYVTLLYQQSLSNCPTAASVSKDFLLVNMFTGPLILPATTLYATSVG